MWRALYVKQRLAQDLHCFVIFMQKQSMYAITMMSLLQLPVTTEVCWEVRRLSRRKFLTITVILFCILNGLVTDKHVIIHFLKIFSYPYLCNSYILDSGMFDCFDSNHPKEHSLEVWQEPPCTPVCVCAVWEGMGAQYIHIHTCILIFNYIWPLYSDLIIWGQHGCQGLFL